MLLHIQFPFADSRKFLNNTRCLSVPGWPLPTPDIEFVRYFGSVRTRKASGLHDWVGENEVCEGNKALRFHKNPASIFHQAKYRKLFRSTNRYLYFDGWGVGKFEVSIVTKHYRRISLSEDQITDLISSFLSLPIQIQNPLGKRHNCELAQAGKSITQLYAIASTKISSSDSISLENWWVSPGKPILFVEYRGQTRVASSLRESLQLPYRLKPVQSLSKSSGLQLYHCFIPHRGSIIPMWVLNTDDSFDTEKAKTLRMHLCRLHAEHECLRLILRNIMTDKISVSPRTKEADRLQYYLNRATRRIRRSDSKCTEEIAEIARASATLISPGHNEILLEYLENLDIRRNVLLNVYKYNQEGDTESSKENVKRLISRHERRLQKLKEQEAVFGMSTAPEIRIEIEDIEKKIIELKEQ
ncbi:MAG: hypothetical protein GY861_11315 [bacterium]|nr:hypothetical protein [bacterium]